MGKWWIAAVAAARCGCSGLEEECGNTQVQYSFTAGYWVDTLHRATMAVKDSGDWELTIEGMASVGLTVTDRWYDDDCYTNCGSACAYEVVAFETDTLLVAGTSIVEPGALRYRYQDTTYVVNGLTLIGNVTRKPDWVTTGFEFVLQE